MVGEAQEDVIDVPVVFPASGAESELTAVIRPHGKLVIIGVTADIDRRSPVRRNDKHIAVIFVIVAGIAKPFAVR